MEFTLRKWQESDIDSVARYADNPAIAANLRDAFPSPYRYQDAEDYVLSCIAGDEDRQLCRAIEVEGEAVGSIGLFLQDDVYCKSAELGYWLAESFWNCGIMSRAIAEICQIAFHSYDIVRIFAEPFATNLGSRRVLEKMGFSWKDG